MIDISKLSAEQIQALLSQLKKVTAVPASTKSVEFEGMKLDFHTGSFVEKVVTFNSFGPITGDWLTHLGTNDQRASFIGSWTMCHKATGMKIGGKIGNRFGENGKRRVTLDRCFMDSLSQGIQKVLDLVQEKFVELYPTDTTTGTYEWSTAKVLGEVTFYKSPVKVLSIEGQPRKADKNAKTQTSAQDRLVVAIANMKKVEKANENRHLAHISSPSSTSSPSSSSPSSASSSLSSSNSSLSFKEIEAQMTDEELLGIPDSMVQ